MTAAKLNLPVIEQGATYVHNIQWMNPDKVTPIDLTMCTAKMQVRATVASSTYIVSLSTEDGRIVITPQLGKLQLTLDDEATSNLAPIKDAVYDLEIYHPGGRTTRLIEGKVTIKAEVTRG